MTAKLISILLTILFISLFSLIFVGIDIPFPTTIIMLLLLTNAITAFFSIFVQRAIIERYNNSFVTNKVDVLSLIYKYTTFAFYGLNDAVQSVLSLIPWIINKLLALLFFFLLLINWLILLIMYNG
ncbi:hypothetical protein IHV12_04325 [Fictibacillus sp. 7GRE50]|uniref:hypothetical protein n=1 Tax=Fictibacillus sp. 7GRE50 TaxID=2745878 RepID=UPI0018CF2F33|nr:hypothetical protein [Fictibacillus sp. 7GRE50]MBH0164126.1 hypothetical protein [Fictibacillus sp. 7GRE50]